MLQPFIAAAGAAEKDVALRRGTIERRLQQLIDLVPAFGVHSGPAGQLAIQPPLAVLQPIVLWV